MGYVAVCQRNMVYCICSFGCGIYSTFIFHIRPLKMDPTEGSETSTKQNLTPGKYPKEHIQYSKHGESLKSRKHSIVFFLKQHLL
jgi:hypothetical protein